MADSTKVVPPDPKQVEVLRGLEGHVAENMLLSPIDEAWQPSDYLPNLTGEDWID